MKKSVASVVSFFTNEESPQLDFITIYLRDFNPINPENIDDFLVRIGVNNKSFGTIQTVLHWIKDLQKVYQIKYYNYYQ